MAKVIITSFLEKEVNKRLRQDAVTVFELMLELEENPKKGKPVGSVGNVQIGEIKFRKFRFYFVTDRYKVKFLSADELKDLIIKFVRMSDKKEQQETIEQIKDVLRKIGDGGFPKQ
jgi:hypothetical protein